MKYLFNIIISLFIFSNILLAKMVNADVAVIVNPSNASSISQKEIKRMFLGKIKKYSNGSSVIAINLASGDTSRSHFEKTVAGKSSSKMKAYWAKQVFSGKGNPPKEVQNDSEAIALVAENPAIIAYVDSSKVTDKVKVILKF